MNEIPKPPRPPPTTVLYPEKLVPAHPKEDRPVPPYVETPPIQILYPDAPRDSDPWSSGFYWGVFIGIGIGFILMKILIKYGLLDLVKLLGIVE